MRYWLLEEGAVEGPFAREQLRARPGFSPGCLVCAEGYSGDGSAGWSRAALVPALRPLLPPDFHLAKEGGGREAAWLPPEPSLEDAAGMASLDDRIRRLEGLLGASMRRVRERDAEQVRLRAALNAKDSLIDSLRGELGELGRRLVSLAALHQELQAAYGSILEQRQDVVEFGRRLAELRGLVDAALTAGNSETEETVREAKRFIREAGIRVQEAVRTAEEALQSAEESRRGQRRARAPRPRSRRRERPPKPPKSSKAFPGAPPQADIPGF